MPKLHQSILHPISICIKDAATDIGYDSCRQGSVIVQLDQVVVLVERDIVGQWVVRPLGDDGRQRESLGKITRQGEAGRSDCHACKKAAPIDRSVKGPL